MKPRIVPLMPYMYGIQSHRRGRVGRMDGKHCLGKRGCGNNLCSMAAFDHGYVCTVIMSTSRIHSAVYYSRLPCTEGIQKRKVNV